VLVAGHENEKLLLPEFFPERWTMARSQKSLISTDAISLRDKLRVLVRKVTVPIQAPPAAQL
jgi:hypothetical protein